MEHPKVSKSVTKERLDKGKALIVELHKDIHNNPNVGLEYKRLERIREFPCHLVMVYAIIFPYLKGFQLTLSNHLP